MYQENRSPQGWDLEQVQTGESLQRYTAKTFLWMFLGLAVTFGVALLGYVSGMTIPIST